MTAPNVAVGTNCIEAIQSIEHLSVGDVLFVTNWLVYPETFRAMPTREAVGNPEDIQTRDDLLLNFAENSVIAQRKGITFRQFMPFNAVGREDLFIRIMEIGPGRRLRVEKYPPR